MVSAVRWAVGPCRYGLDEWARRDLFLDSIPAVPAARSGWLEQSPNQAPIELQHDSTGMQDGATGAVAGCWAGSPWAHTWAAMLALDLTGKRSLPAALPRYGEKTVARRDVS